MSKSEKPIGELSEKNKGRLRRLIRKSRDGKSPECYYVEDWGKNPRMRVGGVVHILPRVIYFMQTGEQSAGKFLRHSCGNKWCVRKEHTFLSDRSEGAKTPPKPKQTGRKLNRDMVEQIRALSKAGWTDDALADSYMVNRTTINRVVNFELWKHRRRRYKLNNWLYSNLAMKEPETVPDMDQETGDAIYAAHLKGECVDELKSRFNVSKLSILHAIGQRALRRD